MAASSSRPPNLPNGDHRHGHRPNGDHRPPHPQHKPQQQHPQRGLNPAPPPAGRRPHGPPKPPPPPPPATSQPIQNHNPAPNPIPIPTPIPNNHHIPYTRHQPQRHYSTSSCASFKGCCCCLFLLLIFLALLAVAVALVIILVVKPKKPEFDLQQVGVSYILITKPADTSSVSVLQQAPPAPAAYLTMNITMIFTASNPNKVGIRYGSPGFMVMYKGIPLGLATMPEFEQPAHSVRLVETRVAVSRVDILQGDALDLLRDASLNDRVELRVVGDVTGRIRMMGLTSPKVQVSVDCAVVISPRRQTVTYKQCGVDGVNV